jgi:hypothetical protein
MIGSLYRRMAREYDRVLRSGGRAVLLTAEAGLLREAVRPLPWHLRRQVRLRLLGRRATLFAWRKR